MDNDLSGNDPYKQMDSGEMEIRPDFLRKNNSAQNILGAAEQVAAAKGGVKAGGATKSGASKPSEALKSGAAKTGDAEKGLYKSDRGFNNNTGTDNSSGKQKGIFSGSGALKAAAPFLLILLAVVGIIALIVALPVMMIGAIDYNLQKVLGFADTAGILEEQAEYVTAEMLGQGKVPSGYASDLADNGMDVGQITAAGDFVKTNVYIADIDTRDDLIAAAGGFYYNNSKNGELALLYNGEVIRADEFVAAVESNPKLYAAYANAVDISARYYYSDDVEETFEEMGISRGNFNNWKSTGNYEADEESYFEILNSILDSNSKLVVGGYLDDTPRTDGKEIEYDEDEPTGGTFTTDAKGEAPAITSDVAENTQEYITGWHWENQTINGVQVPVLVPEYSDNATKRAAELLNTAVSSGEPYLAANAFIAVEEPIQRARIDGDGPVNQVMNTLSKETEVSYQNVATGAMETSKLSILETVNFRAAVSDSKYSAAEAANFGRDRVLKTTDQADTEIIKSTTLTTNGKANSSSVVRNGKNKDRTADEDIISKANESVNLSISESNSDLFQSVVGGNRVLEGGSFLSNTINQRAIGAMPSDAAAIAEYNTEVKSVMARKAEAEQASLSPFDLSSPNTFFGKIVHNIAAFALKNSGTSSVSSLMTGVRATMNAAGEAVAGIFDSATAEGQDQEFTTMKGENCVTVGTVSVEGDLYCTSHNTVSTKYMNYTLADWKASAVGGSIDDNGKIAKDSDLEKFATMGMDRYSTVGVKSAEVCEKYREYNDSGFNKIGNMFLDMFGLYDACQLDDEGLKYATGAAYTLGAEGDAEVDQYSGYMLYNQVYSLLSGETSAVAEARDRYYAEHPRDNSRAGMVARISGLSRHEAEIALNYGVYLNEIANYDASSRYIFGAVELDFNKNILETHSEKIASELYAWRAKETEYADLRNLNFVV